MNIEEAIQILKATDFTKEIDYKYPTVEYMDAIETLLNEYDIVSAELQAVNEDKDFKKKIRRSNFISKDEIIKSLGKAFDTKDIKDSKKIINMIDFLVDEFNRLEDIEDRKVQIEYNKVFNKGVKSVEDKIRNLINCLDADIQNITKVKNENGYIDDYKRNRLKAYKTKTREIKTRLEELLEDK